VRVELALQERAVSATFQSRGGAGSQERATAEAAIVAVDLIEPALAAAFHPRLARKETAVAARTARPVSPARRAAAPPCASAISRLHADAPGSRGGLGGTSSVTHSPPVCA